MRRTILVACAAALLLAACDPSPATPRATWDALRAGIAARDGATLLRFHDTETLVHRRQVIRDWRALLARGDAPEQVLGGTSLTVEEVVSGSPDDAVARLFAKHSPLLREGGWLGSATVAGERMDGADACELLLRGGDGKDFRLWLVVENGRWVIDHRRTWSPQK